MALNRHTLRAKFSNYIQNMIQNMIQNQMV